MSRDRAEKIARLTVQAMSVSTEGHGAHCFGSYVKPSRAVDALADAIELLLSNPHLARDREYCVCIKTPEETLKEDERCWWCRSRKYLSRYEKEKPDAATQGREVIMCDSSGLIDMPTPGQGNGYKRFICPGCPNCTRHEGESDE